MFHFYVKYPFLLFILIACGFSAVAQPSRANKENDPYSVYGIGQERNSVNVSLLGMGSVSSAYSNTFTANTDNPASYASLKYTTYEAGGYASTRVVSGANDRVSTGSAGFSYFNIGIPLGKYAGFCFGLRPQTRVYDRLDDTVTINGFPGGTYKSYLNDGSTNYGFIGAAGKYKGLSFGFNFGYLFGTIENTSTLFNINSDSSKATNSEFSGYTKLGGIYWNAGAMYEIQLPKNRAIRIGGTFKMSQNLNATRDEYWITHSTIVTTILDTAYAESQVKGKIVLPMNYSGGIQLIQRDKWMAGIDYSAAQWSQYLSYGQKDSVANSYKFGAGGEYTPNALAMHKYLQRVTYRLGFYYGTDFVKLNNTQLNYYAITAGFSLPFKRSNDRIHTAIEIGKKGTEANGLLKENFVKFSLGLSFNDKWFVKRPYE